MIFIVDVLLLIFFSIILGICLRHLPRLFLPSHGRLHRLLGFTFLCWLIVGHCLNVYRGEDSPLKKFMFGMLPPAETALAGNDVVFVYDLLLSACGIALALSAARDFGHHKNKNVASGAIEEGKLVSRSEMIEHAAYQLLNLGQILFLHLSHRLPPSRTGDRWAGSILIKAAVFVLLTLLWKVRALAPVNSFSKNYATLSDGGWTVEKILYRTKKWSYVFMKHWLIHGLNLTAVFSENIDVSSPSFRRYWLIMNVAFVMEFFLQTLVVRKLLSQSRMLLLNTSLTALAAFPAFAVLPTVDALVAAFSLFCNFQFRGFELTNTLLRVLPFAFLLYIYGRDVFGDEILSVLCRFPGIVVLCIK